MSNIKSMFWGAWRKSIFFPEYLEKQSISQFVENTRHYIQGIVLDIGCGLKPYYQIIMGKADFYVGLDHLISARPGANSADLYGDALQMPIKSQSINVILCTQVLEHLKEPALFFEEAFRILRPEGVLLLTTNQEWGIHKAPNDYFRFTRYGLRYLCESARLEVMRLSNRGGYWVMMGQRVSGYLYERWIARFRKNYKLIFIFSLFFLSPLIALIQLISPVIDHIDYIESNTLGYALIAQKPLEKK